MTISKDSYTLVKQDMTKSRLSPQVVKRVTFAHQITSSQVGLSTIPLNLTALNTPAEMTANGFVQASTSDFDGARISLAKKNVRLSSTLKGPLFPNKHFIVVDNYTINLIGDLASAIELNEIIFGEIDTQMGDLIPASVANAMKTVSVPVGQKTVNLGLEYIVGATLTERVGAVTLNVRGGSILYRNTNNSTTNLDGDYYEVDSGNGYGTTVMLNTAPTIIPLELVVNYGPRTLTNNDSLGTLQSLMGSVITMAKDLAMVVGGQYTNYLSASPSDIERRTFGDSVLSLLSRMTTAETSISAIVPKYKIASVYNKTNSQTTYTAGAWTTLPFNTFNDYFSMLTNLSAGQITLSAGTYVIRGGSQIYCPANSAQYISARLFNITDNVSLSDDLGSATSYPINATYGGCAPGEIIFNEISFTISSTKVIAVQVYTSSNFTDGAAGSPVGVATIIRSRAAIQKLN